MKRCPLCDTEYDDGQTFCSKDGATLRLPPGRHSDLVGSVVADRYRILRRLGEGGMGHVYLAEHVKIGRKSALKVVRPDLAVDPDAIARFHREATNASRIDHPHVAHIYDFGETSDGLIYLAMEFIEGESLGARLARERSLPTPIVAELVRQVADGLQAAHDLGIVHRDLKPENIMLARQRDGSVRVKLVDFGIAKATSDDAQRVTTTGVMIGTPAYMSPEQVGGGEALTGASDQFALACTAFELLTGELPFTGATTHELITSRIVGHARRLAQVRSDVQWAPMLQDVILQALAPDPAQRYPSVREFAAAFGRAAVTPSGGQATVRIGAEPTIVMDVAPTRVSASPSAAVPGRGSSGRGLWAAGAVIAAGVGLVVAMRGQAPSVAADKAVVTPATTPAQQPYRKPIGDMPVVREGGGSIAASTPAGQSSPSAPSAGSAAPASASVEAMPASTPARDVPVAVAPPAPATDEATLRALAGLESSAVDGADDAQLEKVVVEAARLLERVRTPADSARTWFARGRALGLLGEGARACADLARAERQAAGAPLARDIGRFRRGLGCA